MVLVRVVKVFTVFQPNSCSYNVLYSFSVTIQYDSVQSLFLYSYEYKIIIFWYVLMIYGIICV